jgi:outer membrane lipoprotein-sorting protein
MKIPFRLIGALTFAAGLSVAAPAFALTTTEQQIVARADTYFDQVHTLKARFVQEAANGAEAEGTLYLDRPGKLRLEYAPPTPILVVAQGGELVYYDSKLGQVSYVDLDSTMAGVLVRPRVELNGGDLEVTKVGAQPGTVTITVTKRADPSQGRITLVFTEKPFELRQWQVVDQQGQITTVTLYDQQSGMPLDEALFVFHDPRPTPGAARHD